MEHGTPKNRMMDDALLTYNRWNNTKPVVLVVGPPDGIIPERFVGENWVLIT
jgi:hypothetical protein